MVSSTLTFFTMLLNCSNFLSKQKKKASTTLVNFSLSLCPARANLWFPIFLHYFYSRIPLCWKQFTFVGEKKPCKNAAIFCSLTGEKNHNGKFSLFCNTKSWEHIVCRLLFYTVLITFGHVARHFPGWFSFNIRWHKINILS